MHPSPSRFTSRASLVRRPYIVRFLFGTAKCPEPLRLRVGVTSSQHRIRTRVGRHYPAFFAHTSSCAGPKPSSCLGVNLVHQVFAGCRQPLLGIAPSRRYLCESFPTCLDPYPGGSCGALTRFFPQDNGLRNGSTSSAPYKLPTQQFQCGTSLRGCSHSLMFRPVGLLATQIAPTASRSTVVPVSL
jgi:hypothetical protein